MGRDHSIECERCGTSYGGFDGPEYCKCSALVRLMANQPTPDLDAAEPPSGAFAVSPRTLDALSSDDDRFADGDVAWHAALQEVTAESTALRDEVKALRERLENQARWLGYTPQDAARRAMDLETERDTLTRRVAEVEAERDATARELERWRHGQQIEGDYVCPDSLALANVLATCERLRGVYEAAKEWRNESIGERTSYDLRLEAAIDDAIAKESSNA